MREEKKPEMGTTYLPPHAHEPSPPDRYGERKGLELLRLDVLLVEVLLV